MGLKAMTPRQPTSSTGQRLRAQPCLHLLGGPGLPAFWKELSSQSFLEIVCGQDVTVLIHQETVKTLMTKETKAPNVNSKHTLKSH